MPLTAAKPPRLAPHFNRLFRGLMSLRRRSDGPADVIPHVWLCHCGPERTLSKSVHSFTSCRGAIYPCFSYELTPPANTVPKLKLLYTPSTARKRPKKGEPIAPRIPAQSHGGTACSAPHPCAELWEVLFRVAIVHTLLREQRPDASRQTAERGTSWRGDHLPIAGRRRSGNRHTAPPSSARRSGVGCASWPASSPAPTCNGWRPGPRLRPGRQRGTRTETERLTDPDSGLWPTSARSRGPD